MELSGTFLKPSSSLLSCPKKNFQALENHRPIACTGTIFDHLRFQNIIFKHTGLSRRTCVAGVVSGSDRATEKEISRPPIRRRPNMWDVAMFSPDSQVGNYGEAVDTLKEDVERMVLDKKSKPEDKMILFETLERLGVAYHFDREIEEQIACIFDYCAGKNFQDYDLYTTALHFRLFRQYGHDAPSSVFNKFKDDDGTFKKALTKDIKGLLSLHEATYLKYRNEGILDEANAFATHHLKSVLPLLDSNLQQRMARALSHPLHWSFSRLEARHYISFYEREESKNELIMKFAKLDFNLMQNLHKEEIREVMKWWESSEAIKVPHLRKSTTVQSYLWGACANFDTRDSFARTWAAKSLSLCAMLNDTMDSYATWEEAKKFKEILQQPRWDYEQIGQLPDCIQIVYKLHVDTYEEFDRLIAKQGRPYAFPYARQAVGRVADGYLNAMSNYSGHEIPTFLKCTSHGVDDAGQLVVMAAYFMGKESATKEAFEWLLSRPALVEASGQYVRFTNDIATYKREHAEAKGPNTSIDCYMREYRVTKEEAIAKFRELAEDTWMAMNWEFVTTTCVSRELKLTALNYARAAFVSYWGDSDGYTNPETGLKNGIATLFIHPIKIN